MSSTAIESDLDFIDELIDSLPTDAPPSDIAAWAEARRIMGPPLPGPYSLSLTPYWAEVLEEFSPYSPIQSDAIMKSAQTAGTTTAESILAFYIGAVPSQIMYVSATEEALEDWSKTRLEALIDSCGLRGLIAPQSGGAKSRRSGDSVKLKEFPGGSLALVSARSAARLRSASRRLIVLDEADGCPPELLTGEGRFDLVAEARAVTYGARKKILAISTPTTFDASLIYKRYLEGDRRKWAVRCPLCGHEQELVLGDEASAFGLKGDTKAGKLEEAYYLCDHCHDRITHSQKRELVASGRWIPTAEASAPHTRSRHISALYSPFVTWAEIWQACQDARGDPSKEAAFSNLFLGLPYREVGQRPALQVVLELRGGRPLRTVGPEGLYLSGGIDVQRGSEKDARHPPRLELQVISHGRDYRVGAVDYQVFTGPIDNAYAGAWQALYEFIMGAGFNYSRSDGAQLPTQKVFIDSGDGAENAAVFTFIKRVTGISNIPTFYASKGFGWLASDGKATSAGSATVRGNFQKYRLSHTSLGELLVEVSTNFYKAHLFSNLKIARQPGETQLPGFVDFPAGLSTEYFEGLLSEEKLSDGSFRKTRARNEPLDTMVYALAAGDFYMQESIENLREWARKRGSSEAQARQVNAKHVFPYLETALSRSASTTGFTSTENEPEGGT
jgi:phage terminase large subunit GpA-like protein